jgi:hypothetical protein
MSPHSLVRVIGVDTPKIARDDKRRQPPTYYACSCDLPMRGAKSRRQARGPHREHRRQALTP